MKKEPTAAQLAAQAIQDQLNREYYLVLGELGTNPDIMQDLEVRFAPPSMIKKDPQGVVDPFATLSAGGALEVINYMRQRIKYGQMAG